jgi:hypothetical protein
MAGWRVFWTVKGVKSGLHQKFAGVPDVTRVSFAACYRHRELKQILAMVAVN